MTTQMPYESAPAQPMPEYPTAPPWAPPAPPAAPEGPPWAGTPYTRHGQLMVPYPELMHAAARPAAPSWVPVAVLTVLLSVLGTIAAAAVCTVFFGLLGGILIGVAGGALGLLGAVPAARRARRPDHPTAPPQTAHRRYPYWLAFGLSLLVAGPLDLLALNVTIRVTLSQVVEPAVVHAVQSDMVHGTRIKTPAGVTVQSAQCTPVGGLRPDGLREYGCVVALSTGQSATLSVVADRKGEWAIVKTK